MGLPPYFVGSCTTTRLLLWIKALPHSIKAWHLFKWRDVTVGRSRKDAAGGFTTELIKIDGNGNTQSVFMGITSYGKGHAPADGHKPECIIDIDTNSIDDIPFTPGECEADEDKVREFRDRIDRYANRICPTCGGPMLDDGYYDRAFDREVWQWVCTNPECPDGRSCHWSIEEYKDWVTDDPDEPTGTDFCPRCNGIVDVWHERLPGQDVYDVVCAHCKLIIDVVSTLPATSVVSVK